VVTGGQGFIGTNLVKELRNQEHEVWRSDITHSPDSLFVRCDIGNYRQVERLFRETAAEYVFHAAAEYGRWNGEAYYENLWHTNVIGTKNILRAQKEFGFKMIFFGSAEVYGDYDGIMTEDVMYKIPIQQMNDYALTKWVNELQILNSAEMDDTESVRVRLFNVYGPHEHYNPFRGVVPVFIYCALHNLPYTVYRGHKRTFEYVEDIVKTLSNIIQNFNAGEVYNLGSDTQYTIEELSDYVQKYTNGDKSKITFKDAEPFTTRSKLASSEKAKKEIGHKIIIPLNEGIKKTVEWFKHEYRVGE